MCGRFTLTWEEWRQVLEALGIEDEGRNSKGWRLSTRHSRAHLPVLFRLAAR